MFATTRPNFNYFDHSHNYDATIKKFILLVELILHLFSSINRLICPISPNNYQISGILKVFYNDVGVYFNVCTIYIICIHMYIIHIMNLKINIWTMHFLFKSEICYFNCLKHYLNLKFLIWIWYFQFKFKRAIWSKNWYFNSILIFSNPKISISIQKIINWL
jgi:hypothetical protein